MTCFLDSGVSCTSVDRVDCTLAGGVGCTLAGGMGCALAGCFLAVGEGCTLAGGVGCSLAGGGGCTLAGGVWSLLMGSWVVPRGVEAGCLGIFFSCCFSVGSFMYFIVVAPNVTFFLFRQFILFYLNPVLFRMYLMAALISSSSRVRSLLQCLAGVGDLLSSGELWFRLWSLFFLEVLSVSSFLSGFL